MSDKKDIRKDCSVETIKELEERLENLELKFERLLKLIDSTDIHKKTSENPLSITVRQFVEGKIE